MTTTVIAGFSGDPMALVAAIKSRGELRQQIADDAKAPLG